MASPIGHSLCGYLVHSAAREKFNWKEVLVFFIIANLADIDYLFGFVIGKPNAFHHQFTHSIVFSLIVAAAVALFLKLKYLKNFSKTFLIVLALYGSHVLIDFFAMDTSFPYGEQLLWPFSGEYFISPVAVFRDIHKADTSGVFFQSLFSFHNFITALIELMIFGSLILIGRFFKKRNLPKTISAEN